MNFKESVDLLRLGAQQTREETEKARELGEKTGRIASKILKIIGIAALASLTFKGWHRIITGNNVLYEGNIEGNKVEYKESNSYNKLEVREGNNRYVFIDNIGFSRINDLTWTNDIVDEAEINFRTYSVGSDSPLEEGVSAQVLSNANAKYQEYRAKIKQIFDLQEGRK